MHVELIALVPAAAVVASYDDCLRCCLMRCSAYSSFAFFVLDSNFALPVWCHMVLVSQCTTYLILWNLLFSIVIYRQMLTLSTAMIATASYTYGFTEAIKTGVAQLLTYGTLCRLATAIFVVLKTSNYIEEPTDVAKRWYSHVLRPFEVALILILVLTSGSDLYA